MTTNPAPAKKTGGTAAAPKSAQKKAPKVKKPKKPMPKVMVVVICVLVFVLLLAGTGYCLYTNIGGVAEKAMVLLPQYRKSLAAIDKLNKDIETQKTKLASDTSKAAAAAEANTKTADELKSQQAQLTAAQQAFDAQKENAKTAEERQKAVADIYSAMDADVAAAILNKAPTLQEAADILKTLSTEKLTAILVAIENTDPAKAYNLTKLIGQ
jgi:flagellar motility protein MotE (MotC chaperone)